MSCTGDTFFTRLASGEIDGKTVAFAGDAGRVNVATGRLAPQSSGIDGRVRIEAAAAISIAATMQELLTWEFPKIRDTLFWGPYTQDPPI